jgi:transposase InsO family protein
MLSPDYPVTLTCEVLDCPWSSYYYQAKPTDETELRAAIEAVAAERPTCGYRRVTAQLRRQEWAVNHKGVRRLMKEMALQGKIKRSTCKTTASQHDFPRYPNLVQDLEVVHPDQVWVSDITYIRLRREYVYLAVIMDVFTRCIRGRNLGRSLDQSLTLIALQRGLAHHRPEIHHSDQGVQYAATAYTQLLQEAGVRISMAEVGEAWENGYTERLIRTIKEQEVDLSDYDDYTDALRQLGRFLDEVYMHKRIHSSPGVSNPGRV